MKEFYIFKIIESAYIRRMFSFMKNLEEVPYYGSPQFDSGYICLQNGIVNIKTLEFKPFNLKYFRSFKLFLELES
jgi:hypothetical protein